MVLLAVAGAVVSFLAQRQINNSEGTLAGTTLARWGLWLAVVSGLGYSAYANVTGLALKQQAHEFLTEKDADGDSGFFPRLQEGSSKEYHAAFLLTVHPRDRRGSDPGNEAQMQKFFDLAKQGGQGQLSQFREHLLVRALQQGATVEAHGVQDWKYENRSYQVLRNYRFTTREAVIDLLLPVYSAEGSGAGERRKWFLNLQQVRKNAMQLTPEGASLAGYRKLSRQAIESWLSNPAASPETLKDNTDWARVVPKEGLRAAVRDKMSEVFQGSPRKRPEHLQFPAEDLLMPWQEVQGKIRLTQIFMMRLSNTLVGQYAVEGKIIVDSKRPIDWALFKADMEWDILGFEVTRVHTGAAAKELGPG
jgi:hypothetical protein